MFNNIDKNPSVIPTLTATNVLQSDKQLNSIDKVMKGLFFVGTAMMVGSFAALGTGIFTQNPILLITGGVLAVAAIVCVVASAILLGVKAYKYKHPNIELENSQRNQIGSKIEHNLSISKQDSPSSPKPDAQENNNVVVSKAIKQEEISQPQLKNLSIEKPFDLNGSSETETDEHPSFFSTLKGMFNNIVTSTPVIEEKEEIKKLTPLEIFLKARPLGPTEFGGIRTIENVLNEAQSTLDYYKNDIKFYEAYLRGEEGPIEQDDYVCEDFETAEKICIVSKDFCELSRDAIREITGLSKDASDEELMAAKIKKV